MKITKKAVASLLALFLIATLGCLFVGAEEAENDILFSLDFSTATTLESAGLKVGTSSGQNFKAEIKDGALKVSADNDKGFIIFDNCTALNGNDNYIVEYTFSFESALSDSGYLCYMFRSDDDVPNGVADFNFRYNGTNSQFDDKNTTTMKENFVAGKKITVTIPIYDRYVEHASISVEGETSELTRGKLIMLDEGGKPGLIVRNVDATLYSLTIKKAAPLDDGGEDTTGSDNNTTTTDRPSTPSTTNKQEGSTTAPGNNTNTDTNDTALTDEKGCSSSIAGGAILMAILPAAFLVKKKKDN